MRRAAWAPPDGRREGELLQASCFAEQAYFHVEPARREAVLTTGAAVHGILDVAGPAFNEGGAFDYTPVGGTGASVRTLVRLAEHLTA